MSAPVGGSLPTDPASNAPSRTAPLAVAGTAWSLALLSIALLPITEPTWHPGQWYFLVDLADAVIFGAVASVLLTRGRHVVAWLLALCAVGGGLAALGFQWSAARAVHPDLPSLDPLSSFQNLAWMPGTLAVILVLPWLVRTTPLRPWDKGWIAASTLLIAAMTFARLTDPFPWPDGPTMAPLPIKSEWWSSLIADAFPWEVGILCVLGYVAAIDVLRRRRLAGPVAGRGLGWLALGVVLMTTAFVPLAMPVSWTEGLPVWFTPVLHLASQLFFPAAILVTVLGQRLDGLQVAVSRATVYGLLTGGVIAAYLATVWLLGTVLPDGTVTGLIGVAVVVAGLQPARSAFQQRVDRLVRGDTAAPFDVLQRVGLGLDTAVDDRELPDAVAESLRESFRLEGVAIDVDWPAGARRLAQAGVVDDEVVQIPLVMQRAQVGVLSLAPRRGERLDRATVESVQRFAPVVAATVQLVAHTRALSESRARIAEARDEERRQLRRELHDGFGPALAGIGLGLQAVRRSVDDPAAHEMLDRLATEIEERVEEVRTLARGLLPPVLEELGLVPAIAELADRHRLNEGLAVDLEVDDGFVAVDPDLRGALYGIVAEAMRNVVRHARATRCSISLRRRASTLEVVVRDDGIGLGATTVAGVGLRSMRERADAVGATLSLDEGAPGTVVTVRVPVREPVQEVGT